MNGYLTEGPAILKMADDLTAVECQSRIDQFVEVTNTDEAEAQSVLQDHEWNLEVHVQ